MRAAIYARYSTDKQREESIDDQYRACRRVAQTQGFEVVATFHDEAVSGGTADRPGYQSLLQYAREGGCDVIVTEDISRLWRNRMEYGAASSDLEDRGVHLVTCVGDDTRRDGFGLVLGIKHAIAESARREISYRTKRGVEGAALAGRIGGRCYGYGSPAEADIVRGLFRLRAAGQSLAQIAAAQTAPAPTGGRWGRSTVAAILRNPRYLGSLPWGSTETHRSARDSRSVRRVAREPLAHVPVPQLVDPLLWGACNPGRPVA